MKPLLFVANWKMNMPFTQAMQFCTDNFEELKKLSMHPQTELVLCPSFPALYPMADFFIETQINLGAQNCSEHEKGAYTGEVSAVSLADIGCCYCIVGHSERRQYFNETNEIVAKKGAQLIAQGIQPIICIGESKEEFDKQQTISVLTQQLAPIAALFDQLPSKDEEKRPLCIAYEPIWSIGTGIIPEKEYLNDIFDWLSEYLKTAIKPSNCRLLYGGSVDANNASGILALDQVDGLLIGGASLDFQKLKKIVLLGNKA